MQKLVEFKVAGGSSVLVEVTASDAGQAVTRGGGLTQLAEKAEQTLDDALDRVRPAAEAVIGKLLNLTVRPDEVEIEFGVKLTASAGAVIASTATEANFQITLRWKGTPKQ